MKVVKALPVIQSQIDKLETAGFKVRLSHKPNKLGVLTTDEGRTPYSGLTQMTIEKEFDGGAVVTAGGRGYCAINDQFDRARGTQAAFNRAVHDMTLIMGRDNVKKILG